MKLLWLTVAALIAFAANSILTRMALTTGSDPVAFAVIRLAAGAVMLLALVRLRGAMPALNLRSRLVPAAALTLYMLGFSIAYRGLPSGAGALVMFGMVQFTMFAGAILGKEIIPLMRWVGGAIALLGLSYLLWPAGTSALPIGASMLMLVAGFGWGIYSLLGRGAANPLADTAFNFALAFVPTALAWLFIRDGLTLSGTVLAILAGAVSSGLGYAMWYAVLPKLGASRASVLQLSAPVLVVIGGVIWLDEPITLKLVIASVLVLGGVGLSFVKR